MEKDSFQTNAAGKTHTRTWAFVLIAIAAVRIASTYTTFSETIDEPVHLGSGLELLAKHRYTTHPVNPPLPRVLFALGPWLDGARFDRIDPVYGHLKDVFRSPRGYRRTLVLARAGNLVFFVLAALATWMWARREGGDGVATAAIVLFTTQPIILGYSGLVTHDTAAVAGVALSLLAMLRWLGRPSLANALLLGCAYGFGVACKFSCIAFTPAACGAIFVVRMATDRDLRGRWRPMLATIAVVPVVAAALVFACYGFTTRAFIAGMRDVVKITRGENEAYLFGSVSPTGWWWYFPTALLLKTTIAFLLFAVAAFFGRQKRLALETVAAAGAMVAIAMTSHLDLGIRYVLPAFAPLSVAAGAGLVAMYERRRAAAVLLLCWHLGASIVAHPDYFPYFNELGGRDPSWFLIDSNLDWGQDVLRLSKALRERKVDHVGISLFETSDVDALHFPPHHRLHAFVPEHGWIAISDHAYRMEGARGGWWWVRDQPYWRIGRSIRLYHLSAAQR